MIFKFFVLVFTLVCLISPVMGVDNGDIYWSKLDGSVITSAYYGDTVRVNFEVLSSPFYNQTYVRFWSQNPQTGVWELSAVPTTYEIQANSSNTSYTITGYYTIDPGVSDKWMGWANFTVPSTTMTAYRVQIMGYNHTAPVFYILDSADLTVGKNPLLLSNIGDVARDIGGDGLAFILGVVIIGLLALVPFLLLGRMNAHLETMMIAFGIGISFLIGLFDLWVVFGLGVASIAIYLMINRSSGGKQ